jgi:5-methylcytosine-specific restriction endonuclease McrA
MKKSRINPISKKKQIEKGIEAELRAKLLAEHGGACMECGKWPTVFPFRLDKHEIVFRSQGGSPIDYNNCVMLCRKCHNRRHGII